MSDTVIHEAHATVRFSVCTDCRCKQGLISIIVSQHRSAKVLVVAFPRLLFAVREACRSRDDFHCKSTTCVCVRMICNNSGNMMDEAPYLQLVIHT